MKLLYFYTEFLDEKGEPKKFRGLEEIELSLSAQDKFQYNKVNNTLYRTSRKAPLPENFWQDESIEVNGEISPSTITNLNVIAGANGSGKSSAFQYFIDLLDTIYAKVAQRNSTPASRHDPSPHRMLLLAEGSSSQPVINTETHRKKWFLLDYSPIAAKIGKVCLSEDFFSNGMEKYHFSFNKWDTLHEIDRGFKHLITSTKIIYMTNTLTQRDYALHMNEGSDSQRRYDFVYDCSLGGNIGTNISHFFADDIYKQVKYVFDRRQHSLRKKIAESLPALRYPNALRLRPKVNELKDVNFLDFPPEIHDFLTFSPATSSIESELFRLLGALCVLAYAENVKKYIPNPGALPKRAQQHTKSSESITNLEILKDTIDAIHATTVSTIKDVPAVWDFDGVIRTPTYPNRRASLLKRLCMDYLDFLWEKQGSLLSKFRRIPNELAYELDLTEVLNGSKNGEETYSLLTEFMKKYRYTCEPTYTLDFEWGLSSGEENMLRLFSSLYCIFDQDYDVEESKPYTIYNKDNDCDTVLLFLDEADLTLHPEWQRTLIHSLITFLPRIYPKPTVQEIQILLTTHSPLLLGDIPGENVTYLYDDQQTTPEETFGQNIHTILRENFFLEHGTVGKFAATKINKTAGRLKEIANQMPSALEPTPTEMESLRRIVSITAPGILKGGMEQLLQDAELSLRNSQEEKSLSPEKLWEQLQRLDPEKRKIFYERLGLEGGSDD